MIKTAEHTDDDDILDEYVLALATFGIQWEGQ